MRRIRGNHHKMWRRIGTTPNPRLRDHTKNHGSDYIHLAPFWVHPTYPSPAKGSYLFPATLHPQADRSEPEGPDTLAQWQKWYTRSNAVTVQRYKLARQGEYWATNWRSYLYCNVYFIFICACTACWSSKQKSEWWLQGLRDQRQSGILKLRERLLLYGQISRLGQCYAALAKTPMVIQNVSSTMTVIPSLEEATLGCEMERR